MRIKPTGVMRADLPGACLIVLALFNGSAFCQTQPGLAADVAPLPGTNLPTRKLGPNDLIAISVYGAPELTRTVRLSEKGEARLPMLKRRIQANGLLSAEIESAIAEALSSEE